MKTQYKLLIVTTLLVLSNIICLTGQPSYSNTTVYTPNNTPVPAKILTGGEMSSYYKNFLKTFWEDYYDHRITCFGEATYSYNCHAYAWRISEDGTTVWIDSPGDDYYWLDKSYIEVSSQSEATKVSFGGPCQYYSPEFQEYADWCDHSAITLGTTDIFISKWGPSPRFVHDVDDCPYDNQDLHYYVRPYITGSNNVCSYGAEFTINKLPSGATISWSCSANLTLVSSQGTNPGEFVSNEDGYGWIGATITYNSEQYELGKKYIWSGKPLSPTFIYCYQNPPCVGTSQYFFNDPGNYMITGYHWYIQSDYSSYIYNYQLTAYVDSPYSQYITLSVNAENQCGFSEMYYSDPILIEYCGYKMILSPNPATDILKIEISDNSIEFATLEINNSQGIKVISTSITGKEKTIDISRLQKGVYYVSIFGNVKGQGKIATERFIKE